MAGSVFMLPDNNIPIIKTESNQQPLDADATNNFGSFETLANIGLLNHGLKVQLFHDLRGVENQLLGQGVITTVKLCRFFPLFLFLVMVFR